MISFFAAGGPFLSAFLLSWFLSNRTVPLATFLMASHIGEKWQDFPPLPFSLLFIAGRNLLIPFTSVFQIFLVNFGQLLVSTISHKFLEGVLNASWLCVIWFTGNWEGIKSHWCYLQALVEIISEGNLLICGPWYSFSLLQCESSKGFCCIFYPFCAWRLKKCRSLIPPERAHTTDLVRPFTIFLGNPWLYRAEGAGSELQPGAPTAISKRKFTPLPFDGFSLLYVPTQMASCSLG